MLPDKASLPSITDEGEALENRLRAELGALLTLDPATIDPRERFHRYGLDSAGAAKLVARLATVLRRNLHFEGLVGILRQDIEPAVMLAILG